MISIIVHMAVLLFLGLNIFQYIAAISMVNFQNVGYTYNTIVKLIDIIM